jgi:hypothetical protein
MPRLGVVLASAVLLAGAAVFAQAPSGNRSARVSGVVVTTDESPRPVGRAVVSLWGGPQALGFHAVADDLGRFEIANILPGRYSLSAERPAYVSIAYGASRPGWAGTPIDLAAGQQVVDVHVLLAAGAVVAGTVRKASGEPLRDVEVDLERQSLPTVAASASRRVRTDDLGTYRIYGLAAGSYLVSVRPEAVGSQAIIARSDAEVDAIFSQLASGTRQPFLPGRTEAHGSDASRTASDFVPVYYPQAFSPDDAWPVDVRAGEERLGIDVIVDLMSPSTVSGHVTGIGSDALSSVDLTLSEVRRGLLASGKVKDDASFAFANVAPGRYRVLARVLSPERWRALGRAALGAQAVRAGPPCLEAFADIWLSGAGASGIELPLVPCATIAGRIEWHGEPLRSSTDLGGVRVTLASADSSNARPGDAGSPSVISTDGAFQFGEFGDIVPGRYFVRVDPPSSGSGTPMMVESVTVAGQDVLDEGFDTSREPGGAQMIVALTSRVTSLSGRLELPDGGPATDFTVVAFTTNRAWWQAPFRRVLAARPGTDGHYLIEGLPPGDYYLAALRDVAPDEWRDPTLLSEIVPSAVRVTVGPGEAVVQSLRVLRRQPARGRQ